ncbi:MAG: succinylglutamate desuccinylase/aspartoacylase family protein [Pseudobacteriovorax sp.]|nr:succinylglutamate desuccinylase/aspartoacylase family protein [Pseudobacteriovorax sp.]
MTGSKTDEEIKRFEQILDQNQIPGVEITKATDYLYQLNPKEPLFAKGWEKDFPLTVMAVTHGNEVGGIGVLNRFIELLSEGLFTLPYPMMLGLGNTAASRENCRYLDRDLNRSFAMSQPDDTRESLRARDLEPFLKHTAFFLDIHQTIEPTERPFFIFPYRPEGYEFARGIADDIPIVTHWGKGFSADGACTDEYVNRSGGVGISVELGQKGFDPYQESLGLNLVLAACKTVKRKLEGSFVPVQKPKDDVYTWAHVIPFPEGSAGLDEGWYNFKTVRRGERLGYVGDDEIKAPVEGPIMFPKYRRQESGGQTPKEICRILKRVSENELGKT